MLLNLTLHTWSNPDNKRNTSKFVPKWINSLKERFSGALNIKTKLGFVSGCAILTADVNLTPHFPPVCPLSSSFCSSSLLSSTSLHYHSFFFSLIPHSAMQWKLQIFTSPSSFFLHRLLLLAFFSTTQNVGKRAEMVLQLCILFNGHRAYWTCNGENQQKIV